MENQVLSISQMEELVNLGIDTNKASMCWVNNVNNINCLVPNETFYQVRVLDTNKGLILVPTFTLQDILEILPKPCYINCIDEDFYQCEIITKNGSLTTNNKTAIGAAFSMLKLFI